MLLVVNQHTESATQKPQSPILAAAVQTTEVPVPAVSAAVEQGGVEIQLITVLHPTAAKLHSDFVTRMHLLLLMETPADHRMAIPFAPIVNAAVCLGSVAPRQISARIRTTALLDLGDVIQILRPLELRLKM